MKSIFNEFNDIYVYVENKDKSFFYPGLIPALDNCIRSNNLIEGIINQYEKAKAKGLDDFSYYNEEEGRRYRCHVNHPIDGVVINARRMPTEVWTLEQCFSNLDTQKKEEYIRILTSEKLNKGGLILVCGTPGNGKSTTCAAVVHDRLYKHGGHCNTVEDPVEMPLSGKIGESGFCMQREIYSKDGFAPAVRDTLRGYPTSVNNILLIGEIRDSETAELALKSSIEGRLVISTVHADSTVAGIKKILSYAADSTLSKEQSSDLLGTGLRAVIHQTIYGKTGFSVEGLFNTDLVSGIIREQSSNINQLENEVSRQEINIAKGEMLIIADHESAKIKRKKNISSSKRHIREKKQKQKETADRKRKKWF